MTEEFNEEDGGCDEKGTVPAAVGGGIDGGGDNITAGVGEIEVVDRRRRLMGKELVTIIRC